MWGRTALVLAALVGGVGLAAPATTAATTATAGPPADTRGPMPAALPKTTDDDPGGVVASCRATVVIAAQWSGGFVGQVTVTNTGTVPILWRVTLTIPGAKIIPPPGYIVVQVGASWLIYPPPPPSWNGILPVGASTAFGFTGTATGPIGTVTATCTATPA